LNHKGHEGTRRDTKEKLQPVTFVKLRALRG
jgi:hypothetical protein